MCPAPLCFEFLAHVMSSQLPSWLWTVAMVCCHALWREQLPTHTQHGDVPEERRCLWFPLHKCLTKPPRISRVKCQRGVCMKCALCICQIICQSKTLTYLDRFWEFHALKYWWLNTVLHPFFVSLLLALCLPACCAVHMALPRRTSPSFWPYTLQLRWLAVKW